MKNKMKTIVIIQLFFFLNVFCDDYSYIKDFVEAKEGEVYKTISKDNFDLRLYVFTDVNACFVCQSNIPDILKILSTNSNKIEPVIFFSSTNETTAKEIAEINKWEYKVVADFNNLYTDYYKIKTLPAFVILDNKGKVLFVDKLGGAKTSEDVLLKIANSVNKLLSEDQRIISELLIKKSDNTNIYTSHVRKIIYDNKNDRYLFNYDVGPTIYSVDSKGKAIETLVVDSFLVNNFAENLIDFNYDTETLDLVANINTRGVLPHIFHHNFKSNKTKVQDLEFLKSHEDSIQSSIDIAYSSKDKIYICTVRPLVKSKIVSTQSKPYPSVAIIDQNFKLIEILKLTFESLKRTKNGFYSILPKIINNQLFITNMFADEVFVFNTTGEYLRKYRIKKSKYYRCEVEDMPSLARDEFMYFRGSASINNVILYDNTTNKYYLHFQNLNKITKDNLKLALRNPKDDILIELCEDENQTPEEYLLPSEHIPFYIDNGIVHTSTNEDGLKIYKVKLK